MNKVFLILSIIALGAACYFSWENHTRVKSELGEVAGLDTELTQLKSQLAQETRDLESAEANLKAATTNLQESQTRVELLRPNLTQRTNEIATREAELRAINDKIADIKAIVQQVDMGSIGELDAELQSLAEQQQTLQARLTELNLLIASERQRLTDARTVRQNQTQEEAARAASLAARGRQAVVSAVDPQWGFVVINMSNTSGISSNARAVVLRGGERVAILEISAIERGQIIANIVNEGGASPNVVPGDTVIFQKGSEE